MYRRTVLFLCCSMAFCTKFCLCNAEDDWVLYDKIPEGENENDFQDVYEFKYQMKTRFCEKNCPEQINMSPKFIKKPPNDKDKINFCNQKMVDNGKVWSLRCRRREEFLNDEHWISQTVADYLWDADMQMKDYAAVFCVIKYLREKYPDAPTPKARFNKNLFTKLFAE